MERPERDLVKARELVADASQGGSIALQLHCGSTSLPVAEMIADQLTEAGFEADQLIEASIVTRDTDLRRQMLEAISRIVAAERPILALVRPLNLFGVRRDLAWVAPTDAALTLTGMAIADSDSEKLGS